MGIEIDINSNNDWQRDNDGMRDEIWSTWNTKVPFCGLK